MEMSFLKELVNYGALGLFCAFLIFYLLRKDKTHGRERDGWRLQTDRQHKSIVKVVAASTRAVTQLKEVIKKNGFKK